MTSHRSANASNCPGERNTSPAGQTKPLGISGHKGTDKWSKPDLEEKEMLGPKYLDATV